ncbi:hypothetical protein AMTRI_Chr08g208290 [Amborella trichopoda]|uniref:Uncharacterized protein n=1 Tax=Amborella trichopoda TaxID=13333 RepID=W1PDT8_AMBTC|nr:uncharacterized protein LOC18433366 [Amborella trichopoda]ERN05205.1 hypothetical protein AMTR_s00007p00037830 [Amborella trichopoda]|eukprot:XP_006843530.1 uncharacterized protein LOC18433366 [Amborella trichopoda]
MEEDEPCQIDTSPTKAIDDYEVEEKKQAAADVLFQYSQFVMACIGEGVRPCDLRLHLMKELSGLPSSLRKEPSPKISGTKADEPSSSGRVKRENTNGLGSNPQ